MKRTHLYALIAICTIAIASCSKSSSDSSTYTCTCHYKDFATGRDTVASQTYTDKDVAQRGCDSMNIAAKVIDPLNGSCSL
jgi:hypothetical protein